MKGFGQKAALATILLILSSSVSALMGCNAHQQPRITSNSEISTTYDRAAVPPDAEVE